MRLRAFTDADMREGLPALAEEGGAVFDADALESTMAACGGYPYVLHVVGDQVWAAGDGEVITVADVRRGIDQARPRTIGLERRHVTRSPPGRTGVKHPAFFHRLVLGCRRTFCACDGH